MQLSLQCLEPSKLDREIENIKVTGHSLGGAITALALQKVQEYLEPNKKLQNM